MSMSTRQTHGIDCEWGTASQSTSKKIAILVPNPCNPDYRVIKYAELFRKYGNNVRVYCGRNEDLPEQESINEITYIRKFIAPKSVRHLLSTHPRKPIPPLAKNTQNLPCTPDAVQPNANADTSIQLKKIFKKKLGRLLRPIFSSAKKFANQINQKIAYKYQPTAYKIAFEQELEVWQPDVVHCHDWQTLELGTYIKERAGCVLIFDSHELETHRNPPLPPARQRWMAKYENRLLPQCDIVTTVCDSIAEHLHTEYRITKPMVIVNAPILDSAMTPAAVTRWGRIPTNTDIRSESGFPPSSYLLAIVGNLTVNRGVETVLQAMELLPEVVVLAMIGKSTDEFSQKIESLIIEHQLSNRVKLLKPVNPVHLVEFLRTADTGIIPIIPKTLSYEYALPNKLFECVFAGLPVIASETRELKAITDKFQLGSTFPPGNPKELANAILRQMSRNAKIENTDKHIEFINTMNFESSTIRLMETINSKLRQNSP